MVKQLDLDDVLRELRHFGNYTAANLGHHPKALMVYLNCRAAGKTELAKKIVDKYSK